MNPIARRTNIFCENLPTEVVLYNKQTQEVHCLNKTVAIVWQNADGTRSVDELSELLDRQLGVSGSRDLVLGALAELGRVGLLEKFEEKGNDEALSRRSVGKKLIMAGTSASMLPAIASLVAPTPAMALCASRVGTEETDAANLLVTDGLATLKGNGSAVANSTDNGTEQALVQDYNNGFALYTNNPTNQGALTGAQNDFEAVYSGLGVSPPNPPF